MSYDRKFGKPVNNGAKKEKVNIEFEFKLDKLMFNKDGFIIARVTSTSSEISDYLNPIWYNVGIKGKMPKLKYGLVYVALATQAESSQYGWTLDVENVYPRDLTSENMTTDKQLLEFIDVFIGEGTSKKLKGVKGICEIVKNQDMDDLLAIKGIGNKIAQKIMDTYNTYAVGSTFIVKLKKLGFTDNEVKKLEKMYDRNLMLAYEQIEANIFRLVYSGFRLDRMDKIYIEGLHGDGKNKYRIQAYIYKALKDAMYEKYKSYITLEQFYQLDIIQNIIANVGQTTFDKCLKEFIKEERGKIVNNEIITTHEEWKIETDLVNLLEEITQMQPNQLDIDDLDADIDEEEEKVGFKLNEGQRQAVKDIITSDKSLCMLNGFAGCVDCDTEYFNGKEWVRIADYKEGDMVLSYYTEGYAKLVEPMRYVKTPQTTLNFFTNNRGSINQCLSDGHNFVYETSRGHLTSKPFDQVKEMHNNSKYGFSGKILTSFNYNGNGIELTDEEIRVMVMVMADGTFPKHIKNTNRCYVNIKKERKKERARKLLKEAKIEYDEKIRENGYSVFSFIAPRKEKIYGDYWYNCTQHQFKVITDECVYWDGTTRCNRYGFATRVKNNADFIQFAYTSQNKRSTISVYQHEDGSIDYNVSLTKESKVKMLARRIEEKIEIQEYKTLDGYQYCFEVESHMLVLRRNGRIFVTGNTGKSTVTRFILNIYAKYGYSNFKLCALSGRASSILGESSGYSECANTIHRTLGSGAFRNRQWYYDYDNKFNELDILLVDEISMVDYYLLYSILSPVDNGTKVIVLGDRGQLPSLNFGKPIETLQMFDIQLNELTQVMRQSEDSYILQVANEVRQGKNPFKNTKYVWMGTDTEVCIGDSYNYMIKSFVEKFVEEKSSIVVTTTKANTDMINFDIQEMLLQQKILKPSENFIIKPSSTKDKYYKIYENDYVMVLKNNYDCVEYNYTIEEFDEVTSEDFEGEFNNIAIFNGEIYRVKLIKNGLVILTNEKTDILVEIEELQCQLAYASNCHKCQGSGFKNVFVYTSSSYVDRKMITSSEWLYTAYTRSKEFLSIHTEQFSNLREGINRKAINEKVTLIEYLYEN